MKRIILSIALFSVSFFSFSQTPSKQEIIDWIGSKLIKYATQSVNKDIQKAYSTNNLLIFECKIYIGDETDKRITTINLEKLASFKIEDGHLVLNGKNLSENDFLNHLLKKNIVDVTSLEVLWDMEDNLQNRMKNALTDLIAILKKERQEQNEPY